LEALSRVARTLWSIAKAVIGSDEYNDNAEAVEGSDADGPTMAIPIEFEEHERSTAVDRRPKSFI
jgi:hypothetical protein